MRAYIILLLLYCTQTFAQSSVRIWDGTKTRAKAVTLIPYLADGDSHSTAVIVCPGGSYCWHGMKAEGTEVARWLQTNGISAFVLKYRVQGLLPYLTHARLFYRGHQYPDPLNDIKQAITYVREHADEYHVNPRQVGVMGFSAGGHLAMLSAEQSDQRPDFIAAIYPVVSMSHPDCHKRSRRALLGEYGKLNRKMRDSLSVEKHIPQDCPPVFLVACEDDPIVKYHNSEMLDSALTARSISHRFVHYKTGGHGFGASDSKGTAECRAWKEEFLKFLKQHKL